MKSADRSRRDEALDLRSSCIVQAPAGSGKTELLTRRFLGLLARVDKPEQVLAITFTRKATQEMRERILRRLEQAARGEQPDEEHEAAAVADASAALTRDRELRWNLRRNPGRLQIHTIDGLCARITGRNPALGHKLASLAVTEDPKRLYRSAAREMIQDLGWPGALDAGHRALTRVLDYLHGNTRLLVDLLVQMLARRDQWLGRLGVQPASVRSVVEERQRLEAGHLYSLLGEEAVEALAAQLRLLARDANDAEAGLRITQVLAGAKGGSGPAGRVARLFAILDLVTTRQSELYSPKSASLVLKGSGAARADQVAAIREILDQWNADADACAAVARFVKHPPMVETEMDGGIVEDLRLLLRIAAAELSLFFSEEGKADFLYFAELAMQALGDDTEPGDALLIEDGKLAHILMDEFQDTSRSQFQLLSRLVSGWQPGDGRTLFLVGDPMQSIYRFRQAEVALFNQVFRDCKLGDVQLKPLRLTSNFRSRAELIDWVNNHFPTVFSHGPGPDDSLVDYSPVSAERGDGGAVVPMVWHKDQGEEWEAQQVAQLVADRLSADPGADIAVLARTRAQLVPIADALQKAGVRFEAVQTEPLDGRPVVIDLLSFTRALLHPCDRVAWLALLRGPWCGLDIAELHIVTGEDPDADLLDRMGRPEVLQALPANRSERVIRLHEVMSRMKSLDGIVPLHRRIELAWLSSHALHAAGSQVELENAQYFFDLLAEIEPDSSGALLDTLTERLAEAYSAATGEGVKLMTIHKAKGLEFDTVILPGLHKSPRGAQRTLLRVHEVQGNDAPGVMMAPLGRPGFKGASLYNYLGLLDKESDQHEAQRTLYVAVTRARRELVLSGAWQMKGSGRNRAPGCGANSFMELLWAFFSGEIDPDKIPEAAAGQSAEPPLLPMLRLQGEPSVAPPGDYVPVSEPGQELRIPDRNAVALGEALHSWLEIMHNHWSEQWTPEWFEAHPQALESSLRRAGATESKLSKARERLLEMLSATLGSDQGRSIVSPEGKRWSLAEAPLLSRKGVHLVRNVLDRVFLDPEGKVTIVDYKSGSPSDGAKQGWARQLENYCSLVERNTGLDVEAALVYQPE